MLSNRPRPPAYITYSPFMNFILRYMNHGLAVFIVNASY